MRHSDSRLQDPRVTVAWAIKGLERAIVKLGDGPAERRVRSQFHQVILALERDGYTFELRTPATD